MAAGVDRIEVFHLSELPTNVTNNFNSSHYCSDRRRNNKFAVMCEFFWEKVSIGITLQINFISLICFITNLMQILRTFTFAAKTDVQSEANDNRVFRPKRHSCIIFIRMYMCNSRTINMDNEAQQTIKTIRRYELTKQPKRY